MKNQTMMRNKLEKLSMAFVLAFAMTSCGSDDDNNPKPKPDPDQTVEQDEKTEGNVVELSGDQDKDLTLEADKEYLVTESLNMLDGTTLTIPAGTTIKVKKGQNHIAIFPGAKIEAKGTAEKPIIITSAEENAEAGDWGGIIIAGKANNTSYIDKELQSEIGSVKYGGTADDDDSGTLEYVRIEYTGQSLSGEKEYNALALYSVGSGTEINHIECYEGKDDGIEFFGGTVDVKNIALVNMEDDSIDWTEGYKGKITDAYVQFKEEHDKGVEGDGYGAEVGNLSDPKIFSKPTITNLTIEGTGKDEDGSTGVLLRVGTKGIFDNVKISKVNIGVRVDAGSDETSDKGEEANPTGQNVLDGDIKFTKVTFEDVTTNLKNNTQTEFGEEEIFEEIAEGEGTDVSSWSEGWTKGIN